jgi:Fic-DOC domain mobile mystery protein B
VVTGFQDAPGATPLDPDEAGGLIPSHIATQADLNAWEQNNILQAREWSQRAAQRRREVLDEGFVRDLHRRMFGDTWSWAGTFRSSDKSIGVPWEQVAMRLRNLLDDTRYQRDHGVFPADELALRFHHRLVWIHPFANGNGRHARLIADLLALRIGSQPFQWGGGANLEASGATRDSYLKALRAADAGDISPLARFARS